jgi:hypothetical protein
MMNGFDTVFTDPTIRQTYDARRKLWGESDTKMASLGKIGKPGQRKS